MATSGFEFTGMSFWGIVVKHRYIAYYRVSTQSQGRSGLGLEAQKAAVKAFSKGKGKIVAEFEEVESGRKSDRIQLDRAIEFAKDNGATLLIAKLDRLSRDVEFIFSLKNSGVDFVCADIPDANTLTIGMFATLAQYEREMISTRTKDALQAKKKQGHRLGNPQNFNNTGRKKGAMATRGKALDSESNRTAFAVIKGLRAQGKTYDEIALELNRCGLKTARGKQFKPMTVQRIFKMYAE